MTTDPPKRFDRRHRRSDDQRSPGQRDRDRILYTSALRRLSGVTQVLSADQGHVFHNRLTHTLEVAQIARRLAERVSKGQQDAAVALGGIDADVVEAAALAHDLGHPPFGHAAEEELQSVLRDLKVEEFDGFEGNAQSFRVLTQLACRHIDSPGLDLTRATLNAVQKYPWFRDPGVPKKRRKFGAYRSETVDFEWARQLGPGGDQRCVEAQIMDLADDIAYAIHDLEDFFRAGLIPLQSLRKNEDEIREFLDRVFRRWEALEKPPKYSKETFFEALKGILGAMPIDRPYAGTREQRASLRTATSGLIARYIQNVSLKPDQAGQEVHVPVELDSEITILKELTWQFVILSPGLVAREHGQRKVIRGLFDCLHESARAKYPALLPTPYQEELKEALSKARKEADKDLVRIRIVIDVISSMNDLQAVTMYHRVTGISLGSVLQPAMY